MQLSIVILTYNKASLVLECLQSLLSQFASELKNQTIEIIVVDNHSQEDVVSVVEGFPIKIVKNKENYGFSKGNNIGVEHAQGEYILFLNSDTKVLDSGFLQMVDYLKSHEKVGILGGKLQNVDGSVQPSAGKFYSLFTTMLLLIGAERFGLLKSSPKKIATVDWVSGACLLVKKQLFEDLNGFDEHIFMYLEDMDLCYRAKQKGFSTVFYPHISVEHKNHGSSNRTFAIVHIYEGLLYFYKKHMSKTQYKIVLFLLKLKAIVLQIAGKILHNAYYTKTYGEALTICRR